MFEQTSTVSIVSRRFSYLALSVAIQCGNRRIDQRRTDFDLLRLPERRESIWSSQRSQLAPAKSPLLSPQPARSSCNTVHPAFEILRAQSAAIRPSRPSEDVPDAEIPTAALELMGWSLRGQGLGLGR